MGLRPSRRLAAVVVLGAGVAAGGVGFANAQTPAKGPPPQVPPVAAEHYFDAFSHRGPDGRMLIDTKVPSVAHVGPDGDLVRNPDGTPKLFPLDANGGPPAPPPNAHDETPPAEGWTMNKMAGCLGRPVTAILFGLTLLVSLPGLASAQAAYKSVVTSGFTYQVLTA